MVSSYVKDSLCITSVVTFLRHVLYFQDTINKLFSIKSCNERGTLYHIKNKFGHKSAKTKVIENVSHIYQLLNFTTEGLVCLLVMHLFKMDELTSIPKMLSQPDDELQWAAEAVFDMLKPEMPSVTSDRDSTQELTQPNESFCTCETPITDLNGIPIIFFF